MSDNKQQWFIKISACIESCTDATHFDAIEIMLGMFKELYNDDALDIALADLKQRKWNNLHAIPY